MRCAAYRTDRLCRFTLPAVALPFSLPTEDLSWPADLPADLAVASRPAVFLRELIMVWICS